MKQALYTEERKGTVRQRKCSKQRPALGGCMQIGSVDSIIQQAFSESWSCVEYSIGKLNMVPALMELTVHWAGEGMGGDGTGVNC